MDKKPRKREKKRKIKKVVREKKEKRKKNVPWSNSYLRHHNSPSPQGQESHES